MITLMDWALAPFYLLLVFLVTWYIRQKHRDNPIYKYFIPGLFAKIFGGIAFGMVYTYYYEGGDTTGYFGGANDLYDLLFTNFSDFSTAMLNDSKGLRLENPHMISQVGYANSEEEFFTVKTLFFFNLFAFKKYLLIAIVMNCACFIAQWQLIKVLTKIYDNSKSLLVYAVLFVPSVVFWGSGLMKDTIVFACFCGALAILITIIRLQKVKLLSVIILLVLFYIGFRVKSYVMLALLPAIAIMVYTKIKKTYLKGMSRFILGPVFIVLFAVGGYFASIELGEQSEKYKLEKLERISRGFQSWHGSQGGSAYDLGDVEYSAIGILSKVPFAINVTYFRPYIWEVRTPFMLLNALESLVLLLAVIYCLYYYRWKLFKVIFKDEVLSALFVYSIFLGFAVGFTSYNFGALARYKIPCLTTFSILVALLLSQIRVSKKLARGVADKTN